MVGCAAIVGSVACLFGVITAIVCGESPLIGGGVTGGITFVATLLLLARDRGRYEAAVRNVRRTVLERDNVSEAEFTASFPQTDPTLLTQTRQAIAEFFDVPVAKIHPSDNLWTDFQFNTLQVDLHSFVVYRVFAARGVTPRSFAFNTVNLIDIGDFANEIRRILDGLHSGAENRDSEKDPQT